MEMQFRVHKKNRGQLQGWVHTLRKALPLLSWIALVSFNDLRFGNNVYILWLYMLKNFEINLA
jgi:hypothetical protein